MVGGLPGRFGDRPARIRTKRGFVVLPLVALVVSALMLIVVVSDARLAHAIDAVNLTATPNPVVPGSQVDLRAGVPVANQSGLASQQITQTIDPAKIKLRSRWDITAPVGWALTYSTDGVTFTAPEPTTEAGWALLKAVRATGAVESQGATNDGKQIASKTTVDNSSPSGIFSGTSASGDGWDVIFDDRGYIYNVYHHDGNGGAGNGAIDCHTRAGAACPGTWPYPLTAGNMHTPQRSSGWYDPVTKRMWLNISTNANAGFVCLDLSVMTAANKWCGGSQTTAFVKLDTVVMQAGYAYNGSCSNEPFYYTCISQMTEWNGRLFAWNIDTNHLLCLDTTLPGSGGACAGSPLTIPGLDQLEGHHPIVVWQGRVYSTPSWSQPWATCADAMTLAPCPGWNGLYTRNITSRGERVMVIPDSSGKEVGVCYLQYSNAMVCFDAVGAPLTPPAAFVTAFAGGQTAGRVQAGNTPQTTGTRVYWGTGAWDANGYLFCWDFALNSGAGGLCANWSVGKSDLHYTAVLDPVNNNCLWTNGDDGKIQSWDTRTGLAGCASMSTQVEFPTDVAVPRMGCDASSAISGWRKFQLNGPASFSGATLTVFTEQGVEVPGWVKVVVPLVDDPSTLNFDETKAVDLSTLPVALSGQSPKFVVNFGTRNGSDAASATITAVGDAPQLCLTPTAVLNCPSSLGPILDSAVLGSTTSVVGAGSSTFTGGSAVAMAPDTESVTLDSTPKSLCGSLLSGVATEYGASTAPIPGAVATLINASTGTAVLDGSGQPVKVTTGPDGTYSFGYLAPGNYKVAFSNPSSAPSYTVKTASTVSGSAGTVASTTTAASNVATSSQVSLAVGVNGVVNGDYIIPIDALPDTTVNTVGVKQNVTVTTNDVLSTGATSPSIKLCLATDTAPNCTGATSTSYFDVAGQGRYAWVNTIGLSFQPCSAVGVPIASCTGPFVGTANPATYSVTDSLGFSDTSTYTPTVVPAPTVAPDTNTGPYDANQIINPLLNDSASSAAPLNPTTVKLCTTATATASCSGTTLTVSGEGTYTVDPVSGNVTFDPLPTFTGTATPIKYVVKDSLNQVATSTITPTVTPPPPSSASPDATSGLQGATQTVNPLTNDTAGTGTTLSATSVKLCTGVQVSPNCTGTSLVVAGKGVYSVNAQTGVLSFVPCSANGTPSNVTYPGLNCTGPFLGTATAATYQVSDSAGRAITSTYTPTVVGPSSATPDVSNGAFQASQTISPLANDTAGVGTTFNPSSVKLCVTGTAAASCSSSTLVVNGQGVYTANVDGTVSFQPCKSVGDPAGASCAAPFTGTATSIEYVVADRAGQLVTSTITPTVTPPPLPTVAPDVSSGPQGAAQTVNPLANDTVPAGVSLVATSVKLCTGSQVSPNCTGTSIVVAGKGVYTVDPLSGALTFTPCNATAGNLLIGGTSYPASCTGTPFTGTAPAANYQVSDNIGRAVSSTYTPTVIPAPVATPDASTGAFGAPQTISVLGNDSANAATSLDASTVRLCTGSESVPNCTATTLETAQGTFSLNANGSVAFQPCTDTGVPNSACTSAFWGVAPAARYQVADGIGQVAGSTITPTVTSPPPPVATAQSIVVASHASGTFRSIDDPGGLATAGAAPLTSVTLCDVDDLATVGVDESETPPNCTATTVTTPDGVYSIDQASGVVTYTNTDGITGTKTGVTYQVTDSFGSTASAVLTPSVPLQPTAAIDVSVGQQGASQTIAPTSNDAPGDAAAPLIPTSIKLCGATETPPACNSTTVTNSAGTYAVQPDGTVRFTPASPTFTGTAPSMPYVIEDSLGQVTSSVIDVVVLPKPAPVATNDTGSAAFRQTVTLNPLANDTAGTAPADVVVGGQTISVDPASIVLDAGSLKLCAPPETVPNCTATSVTTVDGTYLLDSVTGLVVFTPVSTFSGTVTAPVQYQVSNTFTRTTTDNSSLASLPTTVHQTVSAYLIPTIGAPAPAAALPDTKVGLVDTPVVVSPLTNDTDGAAFPLNPQSLRLCDIAATPPQSVADGTCTATTVTIVGEGTYTLDPASGAVVFHPEPMFVGVATPIPYVVADTNGTIVDSTITITVNAPTAVPDVTSGLPGATQTLNVVTNDTPASGTGTTLVASSVRLCSPTDTAPVCTATTLDTADGHYIVDTITGAVSFTPVNGFTGVATSPPTYSVLDTSGQRASSTITPTVVPLPSPTATDDTKYGPVGQPMTFRPWTNDSAGAPSVDANGQVVVGIPSLVATSVFLCSTGQSAPLCVETRLVTVDGTYVVNADGSVTFTPADGFTGTATAPVSYQISSTVSVTDHGVVTSGIAATTSALLTPIVVPPPAPSATDDLGSAAYGSSVTLTPWGNDTASTTTTTGTVTYTDSGFVHGSVTLCAAAEIVPNCSATTVTTVDGTYVVNPNGTVTFTPVPGFTGTVTAPPSYQMADAYVATNSDGSTMTNGSTYVTARLIPTIGAPPGSSTTSSTTSTTVPSSSTTSTTVPPSSTTSTTVAAPTPPTAAPDSGSGHVGSPVHVRLPVNDSGSSYPIDPSSVVLCDVGESAPGCSMSPGHGVVVPGEGVFTISDPATGEVTFTACSAEGVPDASCTGPWTGTVQIPYTITDDHGNLTHSVLTVTIDPDGVSPQTSPPSAPPTTLGTTDSALPQTGAAVARLLAIALIALVFGAAFVFAHRAASRSSR